MSKTPTDAATPRLHLGPQSQDYFPCISYGGKKFDNWHKIVINTLSDDLNIDGVTPFNDLAKKIVRAVNLLEAHEAVAADALKLEQMLRSTVSSLAVTLMIFDERANGETDADKRYEFAEKHPEIKRARALLKDCEALAQLAKLKEENK